MTPDDLTPGQARFAAEYLVDLNGAAAYRRAFPRVTAGTAASEAHRLLRNPKVAAVVRAEQRERARRLRVSADRVVRELARVAFADVGELFAPATDGPPRLRPLRDVPPDVRRAVAGVSVRREPGGAEVVAVRLADKLRALELLARFLGLTAAPVPPLDAVLNLLPAADREAVRAALGGGPLRPAAGETSGGR